MDWSSKSAAEAVEADLQARWRALQIRTVRGEEMLRLSNGIEVWGPKGSRLTVEDYGVKDVQGEKVTVTLTFTASVPPTTITASLPREADPADSPAGWRLERMIRDTDDELVQAYREEGGLL